MRAVYLLIFVFSDISAYLSPITTIIPPMMEGSTLVDSWIVSPSFRKDLSAPSTSTCISASIGLAVVTSHTTSPRTAAIIVPKAATTPPVFASLPFSANKPKRLTVNSLAPFFSRTESIASFLSSFFRSGFH
ncbi:unnamed protein product, partial [Meganyctiphanes norvegica]